MLYVVILDIIGPTVVEVVNLASHLATVLQVKGFVYLAESTLAQNWQNQVLIIKYSESLAPMDATVLWLLFVPDPLELN